MRYLISTLLMIFVSSISTVQAAPSTWKINKYKIVQQNFSDSRLSDKDESELQQKRDSDFTGLVPGLRTAQIKELEDYLVKVGDIYQKLGFKEPQISNKTKNNDAYEIFYFDYENTFPSAYYLQKYSVSPFLKHTNLEGNYLAIDSSRALTSKNNHKLGSKVYEDLAHELFHGIQQSYAVFKTHPDLGDWIYEGTATAIGEDIAIKLGKLKKIQNWGQRTYSNTLWVPDLEGEAQKVYPSQEGHRTKGFWRYIGEYTSTGGVASTKQVKPPSYKYLAKLFKRRIYGKTNDLKELDWVDNFLKSPKSRVGRGIGDMYPLFISAFTHYVPDRVVLKAGGIKKWQKCLFVSGLDCRDIPDFNSEEVGCEKVVLNEDSTDSISSATAFSKVSARCFEVIYTGPAKKLDIQIHIESENKKIISSIRTIGFQTNPQDGSEKIIRVVESTKGDFDDFPSMGLWEIEGVDFRRKNRSKKKSVIFVVSNVAAIASQTYEGKEKVKFNFSFFVNTGNLELSN